MLRYLSHLTNRKLVLWCYLVWYLVVLVHYFDESPLLWLTSLGVSLIIGCALFINATTSEKTVTLDRWQIFRFFLIPFCVSSFSALVKGRGFVLIFSPRPEETVVAAALCALLWALAVALRRSAR